MGPSEPARCLDSSYSVIGYNLANITPSTHRAAHLVYQLTISLFQFSFTPVYQSYEILFKVSIATLFLIYYNSLQFIKSEFTKENRSTLCILNPRIFKIEFRSQAIPKL